MKLQYLFNYEADLARLYPVDRLYPPEYMPALTF